MRVVGDIEGNGLLDEVTEIHCIVTEDLDTEELRVFFDPTPGVSHECYAGTIEDGLDHLAEADEVYGHNWQGYDGPALQKVRGRSTPPRVKIRDTLVMCRVANPRPGRTDSRKYPDMPKDLWGRSSLAAYGYRLGEPKDDYDGGWEALNQEMLDYCVQDVRTNAKLVAWLEQQNLSPESVELEHPFARAIDAMCNRGVPFDVPAAMRFAGELEGRYAEVTDELLTLHPGWTEEYRTPKRQELKTRFKAFNPGSRQQLVRLLQERYDWKPTAFTDSGQPELGGDVLGALPWPEAKLAGERFDIEKILGRLVSGKKAKAWLEAVDDDGRIRYYQNFNGTVNARCTHSIVANVPSRGVGAPCRTLFTASPGRVLVGADVASGDLRMLAHYLGRFDGGALTQELQVGDIHAKNAEALAFAPAITGRDLAKAPVYALLYGAGDGKLGALGGGDYNLGKRVRKALFASMVGLEQLVAALEAKWKRPGFYLGLDGRRIYPDGKTTVLNYLLAAGLAVVMKKATVLAHERLDLTRTEMVLHQHDEFQWDTEPAYADECAAILRQCIVDAGEHFNLRCPLAADSKTGPTWAETH